MLKVHKLLHGFSFLVTDERISELDSITLEAATEYKNTYRANYRRNVLDDSHFATLLCYQDKPIGVMTLQTKNTPDNVARGYSRMFRSDDLPDDISRKGGFSNSKIWRYLDEQVYNFYNYYPYHLNYGIDTIFISRNYIGDRKNSMDRILRNTVYVKHPDVRMYRGVPQMFYVWGNDSFLKEFELCQV